MTTKKASKATLIETQQEVVRSASDVAEEVMDISNRLWLDCYHFLCYVHLGGRGDSRRKRIDENIRASAKLNAMLDDCAMRLVELVTKLDSYLWRLKELRRKRKG